VGDGTGEGDGVGFGEGVGVGCGDGDGEGGATTARRSVIGAVVSLAVKVVTPRPFSIVWSSE